MPVNSDCDGPSKAKRARKGTIKDSSIKSFPIQKTSNDPATIDTSDCSGFQRMWKQNFENQSPGSLNKISMPQLAIGHNAQSKPLSLSNRANESGNGQNGLNQDPNIPVVKPKPTRKRRVYTEEEKNTICELAKQKLENPDDKLLAERKETFIKSRIDRRKIEPDQNEDKTEIKNIRKSANRRLASEKEKIALAMMNAEKEVIKDFLTRNRSLENHQQFEKEKDDIFGVFNADRKLGRWPLMPREEFDGIVKSQIEKLDKTENITFGKDEMKDQQTMAKPDVLQEKKEQNGLSSEHEKKNEDSISSMTLEEHHDPNFYESRNSGPSSEKMVVEHKEEDFIRIDDARPSQIIGNHEHEEEENNETEKPSVRNSLAFGRLRDLLDLNDVKKSERFDELVDKWFGKSEFSMEDLVDNLYNSTREKGIIEKLKNVLLEAKICCGQNQIFYKKVVKCNGSTEERECFIKVDSSYFNYNDKRKGVTLNFCTIHFKNVSRQQPGYSANFTRKVNKIEGLIECPNCKGMYHERCRNSNRVKNRDGCVCERPMIQNSPENLIETASSKFIENKVKRFDSSLNIIIRCLSSTKKSGQLEYDDEKEIREFCEEHDINFPLFSYTEKFYVGFILLEEETHYSAFIAWQVNEFGEDCPIPKAGTALIKYFDTVQGSKPKNSKCVNHAIINAYFEYTRRTGYRKAHLWANPPEERTDYLYAVREAVKERKEISQPQKKLEQLVEWYKELFDNAKATTVHEICHCLAEKENEDVASFIRRVYYPEEVWALLMKKTIEKMNKEKKKAGVKLSREETLEKFMKRTKKGFAERGETEVFDVQFKPKRSGTLKINDRDGELLSQIAGSRQNWLHTQYVNGLEFDTRSHAISSTEKLVKMLLDEQSRI